MMEKKRSVSLLPALICLAGMAALLLLWRNAYQNAVFSRLSAFCGIFLEQNPQLEGEVLSALQEYHCRFGGCFFPASEIWTEGKKQDRRADGLSGAGQPGSAGNPAAGGGRFFLPAGRDL